MKIRRALATAAPLAIAGAMGIGASLGTASAATVPSVQVPLLNGLGLSSVLAPLTNITGTVTNTVNGLLGGLDLGVKAPASTGTGASAPASHAAASALNLPILNTCVSCTGASAGSSSAHSGATALQVLGDTLSGGSSSGTNADSGSLLALPANGLLGLAIADWMNSTSAGSSASAAHSRSALTDINLGNGQDRDRRGPRGAEQRRFRRLLGERQRDQQRRRHLAAERRDRAHPAPLRRRR